MTTNLPANIGMSDAELNQALGITQEKGPRVARLKINADAEDENEKPLPLGSFYIDEVIDGKDAPRAYAKKVDIRIVTRVFQFQNYDQTARKMVDESVMRTSLFAEYPSKSGKMKCGKLGKKQVEGNTLSPEQTKLRKDVKCRMITFCLVSFTGTTQDGTEVVYKDKPVLWVPSQSAWTIMDDVLKSFEKQKRAAIKYPVALTLKKEKNGNVTYYNPVPAISNEPVVLVEADMEAVQSANEFVKSTNGRVMESYNSVINSRNAAKEDGNTSELVKEVGGEVVKNNKDMDDEIPF